MAESKTPAIDPDPNDAYHRYMNECRLVARLGSNEALFERLRRESEERKENTTDG